MSEHNQLLKACPKRTSTLKLALVFVFGFATVIALASMGSVSFLSNN